jgi:hypothetical protein
MPMRLKILGGILLALSSGILIIPNLHAVEEIRQLRIERLAELERHQRWKHGLSERLLENLHTIRKWDLCGGGGELQVLTEDEKGKVIDSSSSPCGRLMWCGTPFFQAVMDAKSETGLSKEELIQLSRVLWKAKDLDL